MGCCRTESVASGQEGAVETEKPRQQQASRLVHPRASASPEPVDPARWETHLMAAEQTAAHRLSDPEMDLATAQEVMRADRARWP